MRSGRLAKDGADRRRKLLNGWQEARALLWRHRRSLSIGMALMLVNRAAGLVLPASSKYLIDDVIGKRDVRMLLPLAAAVGIATVLQAAAGFGLSQVVSVAGQKAIAEMRRQVGAHVLRLPVSYFDSTKTGVLLSRIMTDAEGVRNLVGTGIIQFIGGLVTAAASLVILLRLNWQLTMGTLSFLLVFAFGMSWGFRRLRPAFRQRGEINAEVTGRLTESLGGIRTVKVYVAERREDRVFAKGVHRLFRNIASTITTMSAITSISTVIVGAIGLTIMIFGGRAVLSGRMTPGGLIQYTVFVMMLAAPLVSISSIGTQLAEALAGLDRIRELRQMTTERDDDLSRTALEEVDGDVAFDDVAFEYVPDAPVLREVSFHAPAGTTTALVGPSGSGKSTLISLVMGFNEPKSGTVRVDGHDLSDIRLADYRRSLGAVLQDNFLFDGTIRENIAFSKPGATEAEIRAAAAIAHCDEFVEKFELGYETIVGERGVKLSGGQRQRVAIARAIVADPRILIMDEATSSLDSESEAMIRDGLASLRHGRTTFVIAHRLSTIRSADQILVLDDGRIVERGTHDQLLRRGGLYRRLYEKQAGVELDRFLNPGEDPLTAPADVVASPATSRVAAAAEGA